MAGQRNAAAQIALKTLRENRASSCHGGRKEGEVIIGFLCFNQCIFVLRFDEPDVKSAWLELLKCCLCFLVGLVGLEGLKGLDRLWLPEPLEVSLALSDDDRR